MTIEDRIRELRSTLSNWISEHGLEEDVAFQTPSQPTNGADLILIAESDLSTLLWCLPTPDRSQREAEEIRKEFDDILKARGFRFNFKDEAELNIYVNE